MDEASRPCIAGGLLSRFIDQAPSRVRKRLDRNPAVAGTWTWTDAPSGVLISAGEETVRLEFDHDTKLINEAEQASCSCLLSPKCFHLLACLSCLKLADPESSDAIADAPATDQTGMHSGICVTDSIRNAATESLNAIDTLLHCGARRSGLVIQSTLLRSAHQCRAQGLVFLASAIVSVVEGIVRLRSQSSDTNAGEISADLARSITIARRIVRCSDSDTVQEDTIGKARRDYSPVNISRLVGITAVPIVTRTGYSGTCVYLLADDSQIYQVSEVRPGEAELAEQVYRGGFELGSTTLSAHQLCRSSIDVQNMTRSPERRLGRGKKTRWALRKQSVGSAFWDESTAWKSRFDRPLAEQVESVFESDEASDLIGENDLVFVRGTIGGSLNASILLDVSGIPQRISVEIAIDSDKVHYRDNLELLSRSPGLELSIIGRIRRNQVGAIDALMIHVDSTEHADPETPRMELPESWNYVCQLGLDRLERHFFSHTDPSDQQVLDQTAKTRNDVTISTIDSVAGIERQLNALVLGGRRSVASASSQGHRRLVRDLQDQMLTSAAGLADAIASSATTKTSCDAGETDRWVLCDLLAASHLYQSAFKTEYHRQAWADWLA